MEEEIQEILNKYDENIIRYENELTNMENKIKFCVAHDFEEEARITRVKYHGFDMAIYRWRNMYKEIQETLKKINS